jgi:hypothetical protein
MRPEIRDGSIIIDPKRCKYDTPVQFRHKDLDYLVSNTKRQLQ